MSLSSYLVRHITYPLWLYKEGREKILDYVKQFERTQELSLEQIRKLQWRKLKALLEQVYHHSGFYRRRFDEYGITPEKLESFEDLKALPILKKEDIRDRLDQIVAKNVPQEKLIKTATGGTTGNSFVFYRDFDCHLQRQAIDIVYNRWADWQIGDKVAVLWGAPQDLAGYPAFKQRLKNILVDRVIVLDFFKVTPQSMHRFARRMVQFKPKIVYGYSQAIYLLAQFVEHNFSGRIKVRSAVCTAEPLYPAQREFIEKTFDCEVFDRYASRESGLMASECRKHSGFHLVADSIYLEFLEDHQPVKNSQAGEILVTDLLNYGMPFIRYKIGDLGASAEQPCSCGRRLPLLKNLVGRDTDFLVTKEGGVISGVAITALLTQYGVRVGIAQMQIIQESQKELYVKVVRGPKFSSADILHIKTTLHKLFGSDAKIDFEFVPEISKEKSGKFRYTISRVQPQFVQK